MKRRLVLATGILAVAALAGCTAKVPVDIDTAADTCSRCRMSIDSVAHAGEIVTATGDVRKYDSLGCLAADYKDGEPVVGKSPRVFVIDYRTRKWLEARAAWYALANLPTDHMGLGVAALGTREQALALVNGAAEKVVTWEQLLSQTRTR